MTNATHRRRDYTSAAHNLCFEQLEDRRLLSFPPTKFVMPLGGVPYRDWVVQDYVDLDDGPGLLDYNGGAHTYDGHMGVDFTFPNHAAIGALIPVYAVADGTVTRVVDDFPDCIGERCDTPSNHVNVDHGGGWRTVYYHLRRHSATVSENQKVQQGTLLGYVGNSGSSPAHLHFGFSRHGERVESFLEAERFWQDPLPYAATMDAVLDFGLSSEYKAQDRLRRPVEKVIFRQSETPQFWVYLFGFDAGDELRYRWYKPDGSLHRSSVRTIEAPYRRIFWRSVSLNSTPEEGDWQVVLDRNGEELVRTSFVVSAVAAPEITVSEVGQNTSIIDNDTTEPLAFRTVALREGRSERSFTVRNVGNSTLSLGPVTVPHGFSLMDGLSPSLAPGASDTFTVQLDNRSLGRQSGQIRFSTNDSDEGVFSFSVVGMVGDDEREVDVDAPTATTALSNVTNGALADYTFTVTFTDNVAVDVSDFDGQDIVVFGPNDFRQPATLVHLDMLTDGTPRTATYHIRATDSQWTANDNGVYTVSLRPNQVSDTSENMAPPGVLGIFTVSVGSPVLIWRNPTNALDVNGDREVSPIDALLVIDYLSSAPSDASLPNIPFSPPRYLDVSGDGMISPMDALLVINELNSRAEAAKRNGRNISNAAAVTQTEDIFAMWGIS